RAAAPVTYGSTSGDRTGLPRYGSSLPLATSQKTRNFGGFFASTGTYRGSVSTVRPARIGCDLITCSTCRSVAAPSGLAPGTAALSRGLARVPKTTSLAAATSSRNVGVLACGPHREHADVRVAAAPARANRARAVTIRRDMARPSVDEWAVARSNPGRV